MDAVVAVVVVGALAGAGLVALRRRTAKELQELRIELFRAREELGRRERSSREAREVQDLILSSMQEGILLIDAVGSTRFANGALQRLIGGIPAGTGTLFPLSVRELVEVAANERTTGTVLAEVGSPSRWLRVTATPAGDDGSVLVVARDETEARRLDSIRRDFVANASHELKTPAASIQAAAETILHAAEDDPGAVPRFARQLERDAVRLSRIVADLLDLSRLESGSELGERVRLDALVREEAQRFDEQAAKAGLELVVETPDPVEVLGNAKDLSLLVRNLVDNAIRYTRPGGSVTVAVRNGDAATLTVRDTGVGIPHRDLPRVFERFYRVDRARSRETGGTGLGLAIVKHVIENLGGTIAVDSELGAGTTFSVTIPRADASAGRVGR